jgi:hypothetical protein
MKKCCLFLLLILFCGSCYSQIVVSDEVFWGVIGKNPKFVDQDALNFLKKTKTFFIVPDTESENLDSINEVLQTVWDFTRIEAIPLKQVKRIQGNNVSFFNIMGYISDDRCYFAMRLSCNVTNDNPAFKKKGEKLFAYFYLSASGSDYSKMKTLARNTEGISLLGFTLVNDDVDARVKFLYNDVKYTNLLGGHLSTYLTIINLALKNPQSQKLEYGGRILAKNPNDIKSLKNDTLYIPDLLFTHQKAKIGVGWVDVTFTKDEMMAGYNYPYKVLSAEALDEMIFNSMGKIYFMDFFYLGGNYSIVSIFNSETSDVIYSAEVPNWFITNKTIKELYSKINEK